MEGDGYASCSVCLGGCEDGIWAINCPCGHLFHETCLRNAHAENRVCPLCRAGPSFLKRVVGINKAKTHNKLEELRNTASRLQSDVIKAGTLLECQHAPLHEAAMRTLRLKAELDSCRVLHILRTNGVTDADIVGLMNSSAFPKDCNKFAAVLALHKTRMEHLQQQVATLEATLQVTRDNAAAAADAVLEGRRLSQASHDAELQRERDSSRQKVEIIQGMLAKCNKHWAQQHGDWLCTKEVALPSFKYGNAGGIKTAMGTAGMGAVRLGASTAGGGPSLFGKAGSVHADLRVSQDGRGAVNHAPVFTQRIDNKRNKLTGDIDEKSKNLILLQLLGRQAR